MSDEIIMDDADEVLVEKPRARRTPAATVAKRKTTRIMLERNQNISPGGQFFGHNGNGFMLQPGVEVEVPDEILEILDHAIEGRPVRDPQTNQVIDYEEGLRYPYRIINSNGR